MRNESKIKNWSFCLTAVVCLVHLAGCSIAVEGVKKVLGTSIETLKEERENAITKSYYCSFEDCFEKVMFLARETRSAIPWIKEEFDPAEGVFDVLMKDLYASPPYIVVIGIPGSVNTTEVGIFFSRKSRETISLDISSLSTSAKRTVSEIVFEELDLNYKIAQ